MTRADFQMAVWLFEHFQGRRFTLDDIDRATFVTRRTQGPSPEDLQSYCSWLRPLLAAGFVGSAPGPRGGEGYQLTEAGQRYGARAKRRAVTP